MLRRVVTGALLAILAGAEPHQRVQLREIIRGGALDGGAFYTWGERLRQWSLPELRSKVLAHGQFGEGGCLADFNGDGRNDVVLQEGGRLGLLVWFEAPDWTRHVIDREVEMHDCIAAEVFGRRGFLMVHRYSQVRFYEPAGVRDIYSIYTASRQGGLALADVDADGRTDILCGNYWIRSPESFDLPWRLFAINTIGEQTNSALFRLVWNGALVVSQGEMSPGRVVLFRRPAEPREQWPATRLAGDLSFPHALAADGADLLVGENAGTRSRLLRFTMDGKRSLVKRGVAMHTLIPAPGGFVAIGPGAVHFWRR